MNVLIVDDSTKKITQIDTFIRESNDGLIEICSAGTLADAVRVFNSRPFDLVVIDLMLPYLAGSEADSRAGLELAQQLRKSDCLNKHATVIGLSEFPDEVRAFRSSFDSLEVLITKFDDAETWKSALSSIIQDLLKRLSHVVELDFLVFCALEAEREGFTEFEVISEEIVRGLNVRYVKSSGASPRSGAIIRLARMGLVAATREIAVALIAHRARVACMSGICAGFSSQVALGQLVVASPAWEYQAGKWSDNNFEIAPEQIPLRPATRGIIDQAISSNQFVDLLELGLPKQVARPSHQLTPILAPFATGSAVVADSGRLKHIEMQHRKLAALDMETYGLYFAAHEASNPVEHFFSMKCVVDFADDNKNDDLHKYGCIVSARATQMLIETLLRS